MEPVAVRSKYYEILEARFREIDASKEKPVMLSELMEKAPSFSKTFGVKCYCDRCGHQSIGKNELVYHAHPNIKGAFAIIREECVFLWKKNLFKMNQLNSFYEGICNN